MRGSSSGDDDEEAQGAEVDVHALLQLLQVSCERSNQSKSRCSD
jgi:hypothetical protein